MKKVTIARWIKTLIHQAEVGDEFRAHSVRGAAVTAASMHSMSVSNILCVADWSSDSTFTFITDLWMSLRSHFSHPLPVSETWIDYCYYYSAVIHFHLQNFIIYYGLQIIYRLDTVLEVSM